MTWWEAVKAVLLALPGIVHIARWWHDRHAKRIEQKEANDETADVATFNPDVVGPRLRSRRMRKGKR